MCGWLVVCVAGCLFVCVLLVVYVVVYPVVCLFERLVVFVCLCVCV